MDRRAREGARRFPIRFEPWYSLLSRVVGLSPARAYVDVSRADVEVRMAWAFRSRFPRSAVAVVSVLDTRPLSRGVHGFAGRWLVNGSGTGIVVMRLRPAQRGRVLGFPVRVEELMVSVSEPAALMAALRTGGRAACVGPRP